MQEEMRTRLASARRDMVLSNLKAQKHLAIASTGAYKTTSMQKDGVELTTQASRLEYTLECAQEEIDKCEAAHTLMASTRAERLGNRQARKQ